MNPSQVNLRQAVLDNVSDFQHLVICEKQLSTQLIAVKIKPFRV